MLIVVGIVYSRKAVRVKNYWASSWRNFVSCTVVRFLFILGWRGSLGEIASFQLQMDTNRAFLFLPLHKKLEIESSRLRWNPAPHIGNIMTNNTGNSSLQTSVNLYVIEYSGVKASPTGFTFCKKIRLIVHLYPCCALSTFTFQPDTDLMAILKIKESALIPLKN